MNVFDTKYALEHITLYVDTREQDTLRARKRLKEVNYPYERKKLEFGDYSAKCELSDGTVVDFSDEIAIERKMSIDEIALCFTKERARFEREFERALAEGARLYLLIENGNCESMLKGQYRSKMLPQALTASVFTFMARYDCRVIFCKAESTGRIIHEIIYRELKERLERRDEAI